MNILNAMYVSHLCVYVVVCVYVWMGTHVCVCMHACMPANAFALNEKQRTLKYSSN